jgi:hypothetical protein
MQKTVVTLLSLLMCGLLVACSGCILGSMQQGSHDETAPVAEPSPAPTGPRVQPTWQERMEKLLNERPPGSEAWGLFSTGGWADAGQVLVFVVNGEAHLALVEPAADEFTHERPLKEAELAALRSSIEKSRDLQSLEKQAFDGLRWEFVQMRRDNAEVQVTRRVFMNNPGADPQSPGHNALIDAFQILRAKGR